MHLLVHRVSETPIVNHLLLDSTFTVYLKKYEVKDQTKMHIFEAHQKCDG